VQFDIQIQVHSAGPSFRVHAWFIGDPRDAPIDLVSLFTILDSIDVRWLARRIGLVMTHKRWSPMSRRGKVWPSSLVRVVGVWARTVRVGGRSEPQ